MVKWYPSVGKYTFEWILFCHYLYVSIVLLTSFRREICGKGTVRIAVRFRRPDVSRILLVFIFLFISLYLSNVKRYVKVRKFDCHPCSMTNAGVTLTPVKQGPPMAAGRKNYEIQM